MSLAVDPARVLLQAVAALVALALPPAAGAADPRALVTILEGTGHALRATERLELAPLAALRDGDLVELAPADAGFAQIEYGDASVIVLAPGARAQLNPPGDRRAGRPALFLLSGWLKLSHRGAPADGALGVSTPLFDVTEVTGTVIASSDPAHPNVFVESGTARVQVPRPSRGTIELREGAFVNLAAVRSGGAPSVVQGPPAPFRARLPAALKDRFPARYAQLKDRARVPRSTGSFDYDDVADWLSTDPFVRRQFVSTWRAKAREPAFKAALLARLPSHPEWEPIVRPPPPPPPPPPPSPSPSPSPALPPPTPAPAASQLSSGDPVRLIAGPQGPRPADEPVLPAGSALPAPARPAKRDPTDPAAPSDTPPPAR